LKNKKYHNVDTVPISNFANRAKSISLTNKYSPLTWYRHFIEKCLSGLNFCTFPFGHCVVCLLFFDIRILIAPLVSSNSSDNLKAFERFRLFRWPLISLSENKMGYATSTIELYCRQWRHNKTWPAVSTLLFFVCFGTIV
jgi:hypothetical protein